MSEDLFSRDEVLAGHPGRQAHRALFLIESRAAHLVARSRRALEIVPDAEPRDQDLAFLEAFKLGHEPPLRPSIQDLERYARRWEDLVPASPRVRAALAHILAQKYELWRPGVPRIRAALGLDTAGVSEAYAELYQSPLASVYTQQAPLRLKARWAIMRVNTWVDSLPPFWTAYSLSVTEVIGTSVLALPIAIATIGVIPGLIVLALIGLITTLTLAAVAEAIARSGSMRYSDGYFGHLVMDYLGRPAMGLFSGAMMLNSALILVALYIGVGEMLSSAISLPPVVGSAALFLCVLALLTRRTLGATVTSALVAGAVTIVLLAVLAGLALSHMDAQRLARTAVPLAHVPTLRPSILAVVLGVVITAYFGHVSVGNCARVVLRQDTGARSLIWGGIAAQLTALVVYCAWAVAIVGAVPASTLTRATGTVISPLAAVGGPFVLALGAMYVVSSLGISAVNYSLALRNSVAEWLPMHMGRRERLWLSLTPVVGLFAATEWAIVAGKATFVGPLEFVGVIAISALAGAYPMLLLAAARRKGEYVPHLVLRVLGFPPVTVAIYLLFLANLLAHGLFIWQDPVERVAALLMFVAMVALPLVVIQHGALRRRTVIELRWDPGEHTGGVWSIVSAGAPLPAAVTIAGIRHTGSSVGILPPLADLESVTVELPDGGAEELEVWVHRLSEIGISEAVNVRVEIGCGHKVRTCDPATASGRVLAPRPPGDCVVTCSMPGEWERPMVAPARRRSRAADIPEL